MSTHQNIIELVKELQKMPEEHGGYSLVYQEKLIDNFPLIARAFLIACEALCELKTITRTGVAKEALSKIHSL